MTMRNALTSLTAVLAMALAIPCGIADAADFYLWAGESTVTMPDSTVVPVWGFALEADLDFGDGVPGSGLSGTPTVPGPRLVVPPADSVVNIHVYNSLDVPVSLLITGQIPASTNGPVVRLLETDPDYPAPAGTGGRIRSFAKEVASNSIQTFSWPNFRAGSFMYKSGTHQQVQVPMGLYGAITKDAIAGVAYDRPDLSVPYDNEAVLFFSELDPALNGAVASGAYGPGTAMPSNLNFAPQYFLVNGQPYPAAAPLLSGAPAVGETTLLRIFNAGLQSIVPMILGEHLQLVAEDGNLAPHAVSQYTVTLPAGKTVDALFSPTRGGVYSILDRSLNLTNAAATAGGQLVTLEVAAEAGLPVAVTDAYFLDEDTSLVVAAGSGVLANDSDGGAPGAAPMTATLIQGPQHDNGAFTLNADGSFSYQPVADYFGGDFFLYTATDDGALTSEPVAAVIRVDPVNDPPSVTDDFYSVAEDVTLNVAAPGVAGNDVDVDGDMLTVSLVSGTTNGTLTLNANGSFSYTPNLNYFGPDSFSYQVADAALLTAGPATVSITVNPINDVPLAVADTIVGPVYRNVPFVLAAPGVLVNDSDVEGNPLTAILDRGPWHGGLVLNPDGSFTYTPDPGYLGADDFRYRANDGTASSLAVVVSLTVVAEPPIFADDFESGDTSAWSGVTP